MKKTILSICIMLTSFSAFAQGPSAKEIMKKIQPIIYNSGQHRMYSCIKSDYFFSNGSEIQDKQINTKCREMINKFYSIPVDTIDSVMNVLIEEGPYASEKAVEVRNLLADAKMEAKQNLVDFYEIILRTSYPLGPTDPMTANLKELVEYTRKYMNLNMMSYDQCEAVKQTGFSKPNCESLKVPVNQISADQKK